MKGTNEPFFTLISNLNIGTPAYKRCRQNLLSFCHRSYWYVHRFSAQNIVAGKDIRDLT